MQNPAVWFRAGALAILSALTFGCNAAASDAPIKAAPPHEPVLVELFTSQGCSSCPPADALAERVDKEAGLVVVSRPVTYWDRLGWKDTLAREENTALQRRYAALGLAGENSVYTPQMVVGGAYGLVGSDEGELRRAIAQYDRSRTAAIRARRDKGGNWVVGVGGNAPGGADLIVLGVSSREMVNIGRGENTGRKIGYTNVLRSEKQVASWSGGKKGFRLSASDLSSAKADRFAVILRDKANGRVLAAAWLG